MIVKGVVVGDLATNCFLIGCEDTGEALLVDPGAEPERIMEMITSSKLKVTGILNTHGHFDHIGANHELKKSLDIPLLIHNEDADMLGDPMQNGSTFLGMTMNSPSADRLLHDGDEVTVGELRLRVIHTPGHTRGGISLYHGGICLTGDTLFQGSIGRWDFPGGNLQDLLHSVREVLMKLPDEVTIYPGHGPISTIGEERTGNPYVTEEGPFF